MEKKKRILAAIAVIAPSLGALGVAVGRQNLIGPNPGTYFALGMLAALSIIGIAYGIWDAQRINRPCGPIGK